MRAGRDGGSASLLEVVEAVQRARSAGQTVKVVGSGHSFTDTACTDGRLLSIDALDRVLDVDRDAGTVTVEAGITIRALQPGAARHAGSRSRNLGDIDRQTLAGALSTGTHGTGARLGGLATFIRGMELVTAGGEVLRCSPDEEPEVFHCARVGLGALGVVTKLTLDCVPTFTLRHVERAAKLSEVVGELDDLADGHDHFELYWLPHTDTVSLLCNDRTEDAPRPKSAYKRWRAEVFYPNYFFGALVTAGRVRPDSIPRLASVVAGTVGSARLVDRSDRILISTRLLRFVEMEYAIPREHAAEAVLAVRDLIEAEDLRVSFPVEVRFAASDDVPLSTAHGRETVLRGRAHGARHVARALLRRCRAHHGPLRWAPALGEAARSVGRDPRAALPGVGSVRARARTPRSRATLRERLPRSGARVEIRLPAMPYPKNLLNPRESWRSTCARTGGTSRAHPHGIPLLILVDPPSARRRHGRDAASTSSASLTIVLGDLARPEVLSWLRTYFVVTDQRVVYRTGVSRGTASRSRSTASTTSTSPSACGSGSSGPGDLEIQSAGEQGTTIFENVRHPDGVQQEIYRQMESDAAPRRRARRDAVGDAVAKASPSSRAPQVPRAAGADGARADRAARRPARPGPHHAGGVRGEEAELLERM